MNKQEFIDRLRAALNGRIPAAEVEENISYYQDYIRSQIRGGKSEAVVMASLGDPRLIARTIIETSQNAGSNTSGAVNDDYQSRKNRSGAYSSYNEYQSTDSGVRQKRFRVPGWLILIIFMLIMYLIFSLIFSVLSFLAPVILVIVAVMFLVKLFRDWLN